MKLHYCILFFFLSLLSAIAQNHILIKNVNVWDGTSVQLNENMDVLIQNNLILEVAKDINAPEGATIIEGDNKTLIPGLSDMHVHLALTMGMSEIRNDADWMYTAVKAGKSAENFLMLGFTTVRDLGGAILWYKKSSR